MKASDPRDAKARAGHWTPEGKYQDDNGAVIQERDLLAKAFAEVFARTPEVKAEIGPQSLRFLSNDLALEEGLVRIDRGMNAPFEAVRYHAPFVREDGTWRLVQLQELQEESAASIVDRAWLIGDWKSSAPNGAEIRTTDSWDAHNRFIHVMFTIREKNLVRVGSQVIGVDLATGAPLTWTFKADGGVGQAEWSEDGHQQVLNVTGTLADGRTLVETNVLRKINHNVFT